MLRSHLAILSLDGLHFFLSSGTSKTWDAFFCCLPGLHVENEAVNGDCILATAGDGLDFPIPPPA